MNNLNAKAYAEELFNELSVEELAGQLMCIQVTDQMSLEEFEEIAKEVHPGGLFFGWNNTKEKIKAFTDIANKYTKIPVIIASDVENGPGCVLKDEAFFPRPMAWGACDDEKLIERGGKATAQICRSSGMHWSFAPVVDIYYNSRNPVVNTRAASDSPKQVAKIMGAYLKGLQSEGLMAGGCKHFPGDGMDDRNQHFCTTINSLSKEEWMNTYGYVYKEMFKLNPGSVMVGHISLPAFQEEKDEMGAYLPGTLSKSLMTDLLRKELGFDGCIVSDAMSMIGVSAIVPEEKLPVEFINAGGDMILFADHSYFDYVKAAVLDGTISMERLKDAVGRVLKLKESVGLLAETEPKVEVTENIEEIATEIAEKSIKVVRNLNGVLPVKVNKGDTVLLCSLFFKEIYSDRLRHIEEDLNSRGIKTVHLKNPGHRDIAKAYEENDFACVLVNCNLSTTDSPGNSINIDWISVFVFWRGLIFKHPNVVFTSFGDPYKLYELPFLKTYVNAFSSTKESQKAFVRVLLGEIEAKGKNPVELKGFFEREV